MAAIEKRTNSKGKTTHRVKIRMKGYPVESATFERLTDARKWVQQTETAIREGRHFKTREAQRHTLAELVDRYIRDILPTKPKQAYTQKQQLEWWKAEIGHHALSDVTPSVIVECRDKLALKTTHRGTVATPATVNRYLAALSHALTIATNEWGWLEDSPMRKVRRLKEPRGRVRFLSDDERARLLDACKASKNPDLYPAVILALSTGARQQEIMGLRWPDVDLKREVIILHETKTDERRAPPLQCHALELVTERGKVRRLDTDLLFPGKNPQKPVDLRAPWQKALKAAAINDFHWHDLRHTAASYLAMNGATLAEIAEILGHKTLQMVKRYSHLSEAHTSKVVARMNAAIFGKT